MRDLNSFTVFERGVQWLKGTEDQRRFAADVIAKLMRNRELEIGLIAATVILSDPTYSAEEAEHTRVENALARFVLKILAVKSDASWWISHREDFWKQVEKYALINKFYEEPRPS